MLPSFTAFLGQESVVARAGGKKCVHFAVAGEKGLVEVWRSDTGRCVLRQQLPTGLLEGGELTALHLLSDGRTLLATTADFRILFVGAQVPAFNIQQGHRLLTGPGVMSCCVLRPLLGPREWTESKSWRIPQGAEDKKELAIRQQLIGDHGEVTDLRFLGTPETPSHLVVATNSATLRIFGTDTARCSASLEGHSDVILAIDVGAAIQSVFPYFSDKYL